MTDMTHDRTAAAPAITDIVLDTHPRDALQPGDPPAARNLLLHWALFAAGFGGMLWGLSMLA